MIELPIEFKNRMKETLGDEYNDLSMFQIVGYSVAMGNANEKIKTQCTKMKK